MDGEDVLYIAVAGVSLILIFHVMNAGSTVKSGPPVNGNKAHPPAGGGKTTGPSGVSFSSAADLFNAGSSFYDTVFGGSNSDNTKDMASDSLSTSSGDTSGDNMDGGGFSFMAGDEYA